MRQISETYDVVVCGGGLAGFCAAVAAARHGAKTCLVQDRPVFGGNSSSEVRVTVHGAACFHVYGRETGIISELLIEERARNHEPLRENGWTNSVWDMVMYDMAMSTPNLSFHLNTTVRSVTREGRRIRSVTAQVANAETELTLEAETFLDCTGDAVVADLAGCEWRWGTESRDEFGEPHAPPKASSDTMGSSIMFKAKDMGRPVPFIPPAWAMKYEDASFFYKGGRPFQDLDAGYWWIEIGVPWNTIYDTEDIRHELTRHALGVWDWMKNRDPNLMPRTANFALDWIGQVPGKRESRRVMGQYLMTEHDPQARTVFPDEIAYGGWFIDLHTPGGLLAGTAEASSAEGWSETTEYAAKSYCGPYGIPLRILLSKDVDNLMMAGRNVSVTHAALGTVRVMATTALMGQAAGTAAALARRQGQPVSAVPNSPERLQQVLLRDGCFLPNAVNADPTDLARFATASASSSALLYGGSRTTQAMALDEPLTYRRGQWIAISEGQLDAVSVCLSNESDVPQTVVARLVPVDHIWDYRGDTGTVLAEPAVTVPPGIGHWVSIPVGVGCPPGRYVRLELGANPNVHWHSASETVLGHPASYEMSNGRMRRYRLGGTLCFHVSPPQACFEPASVLSGVTRPYRTPNLWRSAPERPLPQWLDLEWQEPQEIRQVEVTFPGYTEKEYHHYPPFYRDPECPKAYGIEVFENESWREVMRVEENFHRHRRHPIDAVSTSRLRVVVYATNGSPSAGICEVRAY
jgi:hypothetical protein